MNPKTERGKAGRKRDLLLFQNGLGRSVTTETTIKSGPESLLNFCAQWSSQWGKLTGLPEFRLHLGEAGAGRRIRDADEMVAGRTLNLASGVARVALQRLVSVGTIEFEIGFAHKLLPDYAQLGHDKYIKKHLILLPSQMHL
jgi:hypothetical protein